MPKLEIRNRMVNYVQKGKGIDLVFLHGWGQNMQMMSAIESHLSDRFSVWNLDFPGFGESEEPSQPWTIGDYSNLLESFIKEVGIKNSVNPKSINMKIAIVRK